MDLGEACKDSCLAVLPGHLRLPLLLELLLLPAPVALVEREERPGHH